ncbi:ATP-binding protein [Paraburkholderia sp. RL17-373-BIF-A]|uniref:ATP-binding protein n=1 Tax=Paraburkholderia sp. RL17-373-BIF-A TaxID=3031629 RepID=UPI0038BE1B96
MELHDVERDVKALLRNWQALPDAGGVDQVARYFATDPRHIDSQKRISRSKLFVEKYGSHATGEFVDIIVLLDGGYARVEPRSDAECCGRENIDLDLENVTKLRHLPAHDGLIWGVPYSMDNGEWHLSIGGDDPATGVIVGVTARLSPRFIEMPLDGASKDAFVWVDATGRPLTPVPAVLQDSLTDISSRCSGLERLADGEVLVSCSHLEATGWRMIYVLPTPSLTDVALVRRPLIHLLIAAVMLLTWIGLLFSLPRSFARRLTSRFKRCDGPETGVHESLPEKRTGEAAYLTDGRENLIPEPRDRDDMRCTEALGDPIQSQELGRNADLCSKLKDEQLTCMIHEIRTPLNGLVGALTLLSKSSTRSVDEDNLINTAIDCSDHVLEIINNLLDFSRIESGQMVVTPRTQDPLIFIDQSMHTVQVLAQQKRLQLRAHVTASFPSVLTTDGLRLRQILINLLGNAVKFTSQGEVTLRAWSADGKVYFNVRDTGPGIPNEWRDDVFVAFKRLNTEEVGSGLGLPIAHSLARLLGGDLYCVAVDGGACFQLELPCENALPQTMVSRGVISAPTFLHRQLHAWGYQPIAGDNDALNAPELAYLPAKLRQRLMPDLTPEATGVDREVPISAWALKVLIVDDVDINRNVLGQMLRLQGHQVWEAAGGEGALILGGTHVFDLVLMDLRMPTLSGIEIVSLWRDETSGMLDPDCPIVALTAKAQAGERERMVAAGFNEFLTKPVTLVILARALDLAADLQLSRGMELAPNPQCRQPMLPKDDSRSVRLISELRVYFKRLKEALSAQDEKQFLFLLHTLKGLTGQAGLRPLYDSVRYLEEYTEHNDSLPPHVRETIAQLIESEIEILNRSCLPTNSNLEDVSGDPGHGNAH